MFGLWLKIIVSYVFNFRSTDTHKALPIYLDFSYLIDKDVWLSRTLIISISQKELNGLF